jgi:hypothetical protein
VAIAGILAEVLEPGLVGSVSTLGGTYRPWGHGPGTFRSIAARYLEAVAGLAALEERTGKQIVLAVEPEPDTTFETAEDVIGFFEGYLLPAARARRGPRALSEASLRRHFTVNLDTCHMSVVFRSPAGEMARLAAAGIGIGKLHVTSALSLRQPGRSPRAYRQLAGLDEPRYLHQTRGVDAAGRAALAVSDLDRLPPQAPGGVAELRTHFHVPVNAARFGRLRTTQADTRQAVVRALRQGLSDQLVIETYTWPILAREDALVEGIAREFRWLLKVIASTRS